MNIQQRKKQQSSPSVSSKSHQQMAPSAEQILKAKYQNYLLERADRQEVKG
jgi:hypothetical protein